MSRNTFSQTADPILGPVWRAHRGQPPRRALLALHTAGAAHQMSAGTVHAWIRSRLPPTDPARAFLEHDPRTAHQISRTARAHLEQPPDPARVSVGAARRLVAHALATRGADADLSARSLAAVRTLTALVGMEVLDSLGDMKTPMETVLVTWPRVGLTLGWSPDKALRIHRAAVASHRVLEVTKRPGGSRRVKLQKLTKGESALAWEHEDTVEALATAHPETDLLATWIASVTSPLWAWALDTDGHRLLPEHCWVFAIATAASMDPHALGLSTAMIRKDRRALVSLAGPDWVHADIPALVAQTGADHAHAEAAREYRRAADQRATDMAEFRRRRSQILEASAWIVGKRIVQTTSPDAWRASWLRAASARADQLKIPDDLVPAVTRAVAQSLERRGGWAPDVALRIAIEVVGEVGGPEAA